MPLIAVTRLRLRHWRFWPGFVYLAVRSRIQAKRARGNQGDKVFNDANLVFWTCTAWTDESAMREYMFAEPHKSAMRKLADWCDEASVAHWTQDSAALPDWTEAYRRLVETGRRSRVRSPSPAHESFEIPPPRAG